MPLNDEHSPLHTWYLLVRIRRGERPTLIRCCQAGSKRHAARIFAKRLNSTMGNQAYTATELLTVIKRADALTEEEKTWIMTEDPELLAL